MLVLVEGMNLGLPKGPTIVEPRTVLVAMAMGVGITVLASVLPARRATRVPPIAAVREGATLPPTKLAEQSHSAGIVVTAPRWPRSRRRLRRRQRRALALLLGGGALGLFIGIALLAPRFVKPLTRVVGWPARRIGGAAGNLALRTPSATPAARPRPPQP